MRFLGKSYVVLNLMDPNYPKTCPKNPDPSNNGYFCGPLNTPTSYYRFKPTLPLGRVQPGIFRVGRPVTINSHGPNGKPLRPILVVVPSTFLQAWVSHGGGNRFRLTSTHIRRMEILSHSGVFFFPLLRPFWEVTSHTIDTANS